MVPSVTFIKVQGFVFVRLYHRVPKVFLKETTYLKVAATLLKAPSFLTFRILWYLSHCSHIFVLCLQGDQGRPTFAVSSIHWGAFRDAISNQDKLVFSCTQVVSSIQFVSTGLGTTLLFMQLCLTISDI